MAPSIETSRLRLRSFALEDLDPAAAAMADPNVYRHLSGSPSTREEVWRRMLMAPGMWALLGFGFWTVELKETGRWIGEAGFGSFKREMEPPMGDDPEMGWIFAAEAHGRGFAREAVDAAIIWGEARFAEQRFLAVINEGNDASLRLAGRVGFVPTGKSIYKDSPVLVLTRPAPSPA